MPTAEKIGRFDTGQATGIHGLSFSSDGRRLLTFGCDATVLLWDVETTACRARKPSYPLTRAELEQLWLTLGDARADRAFTAIWTLVSMPQETVALLKEKVKPWRLERDRIAQWITDLENERFAVRDKATAAIMALGELAVPTLQGALVPGLRLEKRRRLEMLIKKVGEEPLTLQQLRDLRALEVLELIGTPETRPLLEAIAGGDPEARLTQDALIALQRLKQ